MIGFAIVTALMVAVALVFLLRPLLRSGGGLEIDHASSNLALLRSQLAELERDLGRRVITEDQYGLARQELERRVLDESRDATIPTATKPAFNPRVAVLLAVMVPVAAILLYKAVGAPEQVALSSLLRSTPPSSLRELSPQQLQQLIKHISAHLKQRPEDVEGWAMLARCYNLLHRFEEAAGAYWHALRFAPDQADLLADYADTVATQQQGDLAGQPTELIERALAIDPTHWKALALAGRAAFQRGDYEHAIVHWEKLKATAPADSPVAKTVDAWIADARAASGPEPTGPSAITDAAVAGVVSLSPKLAGVVGPRDSLFVFARAADGPPMPLAVLRKEVTDLPFAFSLDDSMAMAPEMKISRFSEVIVGARISKSGTPLPQSGDLEGLSAPVKVGSTDIVVVIDRVLP
jgi:cytochrome c-type biogenesis protein CcmH